MDNSELLKTLNEAYATRNQTQQKKFSRNKVEQQKYNQEQAKKYKVFITEFKNSLIDLVKNGDFEVINNFKQIEGKIVFEKSIDLGDASQTFYTKVYGPKNCIELSHESYLGLFNNKYELRSFVNFFNHSLEGIANIHDYDNCECFKRKYKSQSSCGYKNWNRVFYFRARF